MCGLTFVGLGVGRGEIPLSGLDAIKEADVVYLDIYTSPMRVSVKDWLERLAGRGVEVVEREFVEDGREILRQASKGTVVLAVSGDPMAATTHGELRLRASAKDVGTKVIHGSSILSVLPGELGLHTYSFGRAVTLTRENSSAQSVYDAVFGNLLLGLHTVILLEYDQRSGVFLKPSVALSTLLHREREVRRNAFAPESLGIVACRVGGPRQLLKGGSIKRLVRLDYGKPPHVIVIPGRLHFTEVEALKMLVGLKDEVIVDNSLKVRTEAVEMVAKYVAKTRSALNKTRSMVGETDPRYSSLFENIECYLSDAERFLNEKKYELAVLSIGYAEGLLDSLRLLNEVKVPW